jgi:hypothetical protein
VLSPTKKILSTGNIFSRYSTANRREKRIGNDENVIYRNEVNEIHQ